jgi:hypothetical protein
MAVGGKAADGCAASPSQMGRFETRWLTAAKNRSSLADLSGQWIDKVYRRRPPRGVVLDMDSSVSPTHGEQELSIWNGHYECGRYHPLFVFNQFGDLERSALRPGNVHRADECVDVLMPDVARYQCKVSCIYFRADAGFANPQVYEYLEAEGTKYAIRLRPTVSYKSGLATCSRARSAVRRTKCAVAMRTSPVKPEPGRGRVTRRQGRKRPWLTTFAPISMSILRLQLHALAYNLGNFLRTLATPEPIKDWSLTSLKDMSRSRWLRRHSEKPVLRSIGELRPPPATWTG